MNKTKFLLKRFVFLCPVFVFLFFFVFKRNMSIHAYHSHVLEGGILEITTEINYLICFFLAWYIYISFRNIGKKLLKWLYFLLSLGMLFIFLEEISYGQRLFNIEPPDYFKEKNRQDEINFHNMIGFGLTKSMWIFKFLIGLYGTFSLYLATKLISKKIVPKKCVEIVSWICPNYILIPCFSTIIVQSIFVNFIIGKENINKVFDKFFVHFHGHEITELILSFGFLFFLSMNAYRIHLVNKTYK